MGTVEFDLPTVKSQVLRTEVLAALRQAILAGGIPIGTRLLEADVARSMGVSRAPVREAIRQLEQEGLIESFIHRGAIVVGLPEDEIDAIYELRALIEAKAIERACELARDQDLDELDEFIREMRAAVERDDRPGLAELDLHFHGRVVELSSFTLLRRMWTSLDGLVRVRSFQALERPSPVADHFLNDSPASHERLVEALRLRDPELAASRVTEHILEVAARLGAEGAGTDDAHA